MNKTKRNAGPLRRREPDGRQKRPMLQTYTAVVHWAIITMNASRPKLKIVLLAAGFSQRLGRPKALVRMHGVSLLRRTLLLAAALAPRGIIRRGAACQRLATGTEARAHRVRS